MEQGQERPIARQHPEGLPAIADYQKSNPDLAEALRGHLVELDEDGVLTDDWERFFQNRCRRISEALKDRLIARPQDEHGVVPEQAEEDDGV